ncbi:MAG: membrane protein insertase YidC [Micavibrio aeruginosavorus]|uniref:Membrane protein insertase YidC n=1 Tax=Micavibrio aeruginosavorus TaxID=349221 RepID=A0A2W5FUJ6_9BACT|nr:MAG: membrane protein insertase YidC [Micavibrio aeruginosavorus]
MNDNNQNGMHPQDIRNLIIFLACAIVLWFGFDHFVMKPKVEAARQQAAIAAAAKPAPTATAETNVVRPRFEIVSEEGRVKFSSPQIEGTISLTGARIDDVQLKNYFTTLNGNEPVTMYSPLGTANPYYAENGWIADDASIAVPSKTSVWKKVSGEEELTPKSPLILQWDNGAGLVFERRIEIDDNFMFTVTQKVTNASGKAVTLYPYSSITRKGIPHHSSTVGYEGPIGYVGEDLHEIKYAKLIKEPNQSFEGTNGWIGFGEKYWMSSVIPEQTAKHTYRFTSVPAEPEEQTLFQVDIRGEAVNIGKDGIGEDKAHIFVGAKKIDILDTYESKIGVKHLDLAVDFGILYFLTRPMYFFLTLFNSWVGNFGIAIILLTCLVRLAVFPLANASYKSFAKMKVVAPRMAELRVKYANDKPKLQQELIKLYETERVNPMAGCFPLLLQIPIFFAVYKVISIAIEMRHAPFFGWIKDLSEQDPLSVFNLFGLLPFEVPGVLHIGPWSIAMLILMLLQQKLNPPPTDAIQKDMMRFMPWVMTFVLSKFPSGLVIYWTFSNLISFIQQYAIMKKMGVPVYLFEKDEALAHAASHKTALEDVVTKAKAEKEYLKHKVIDVEEALFDAEDRLLDAAEGKDSKKTEDK